MLYPSLHIFGGQHSHNGKLMRSIASFRLNFISKAHEIVMSGFIKRKKLADKIAMDVKVALNGYNYIFETYDITKVF